MDRRLNIDVQNDISEMELGTSTCDSSESSEFHASGDVFVDNEDDHIANRLKPSSEILPRKSSLKKSDNQNRDSKKKTVSFSAITPDDKTIASATDCLYFMQNGSVFIKLKSSGRQYKRVFLLSSDLKEITWLPSSKKLDKAKISIDQIKEIRCGRLSSAPKSLYSHNGCFFSIVTGDSFQSLDLIANSADEANTWITGLNFLKLKNEGGNVIIGKPLRDKWLENTFQKADIHEKGSLAIEEVADLMKKINCNLSSHQIQRLLRETRTNKEGGAEFGCSEFVDLFKKISARPDILSLFIKYAKKADYMTFKELKIFSETEQGVAGLTPEKCMEIISTYEPSPEGKVQGHLGIDGFSLYLMSRDGSIFDPSQSKICQDMCQPLCHYLIASSCNSSFTGYEAALKKGCRYLTVDCWDGPNDEPMVKGRRELNLGQMFRSAIEIINQHAFCKSPYPLIINVLNRCHKKQQRKMVTIMREIFNDKIPTRDQLIRGDSLSSPESLKFKIVLMSEKLFSDEDEEFEGSIKNEEILDSKIAVVDELFDCIHFNLLRRGGQLDCLVKGNDVLTSVSLNESLAMKLSNICYEEMLNYNKRFLTLVVPNETRADSSNYHPHDFWSCGCQLVSLNYHTNGAMMDLNDGMFLQNGGCGYVLKPAAMRDEISSIKANSRGFIPGISAQILYVRIISALNLPKPLGSSAKGTTLDPYVTVEVIGIPSDCSERRTRTIQHLETSTTSPMFEESFEFVLNLPDSALVRFAVLDDDYMGDDFVGQCTLPVSCMRHGYRHIPLRSSSGDLIGECFLFVHVAVASRRRSPSTYRGVRKRSSDKEFENLKSIGLKVIDDNFKSSLSSMKEASELMSRIQESFSNLRRSCGMTGIANAKQTIRHLFGRIQDASEVSSEVEIVEEFPVLKLSGNVPDIIRKSVLAFETFIVDNYQLQTRSDEIINKLTKCRHVAMELHEDLPNVLQSCGIKGNKLNKAIENCAWNIRLLKGQEDLLERAKVASSEDIKQVVETSTFLGLIKDCVRSDLVPSDEKSDVA